MKTFALSLFFLVCILLFITAPVQAVGIGRADISSGQADDDSSPAPRKPKQPAQNVRVIAADKRGVDPYAKAAGSEITGRYCCLPAPGSSPVCTKPQKKCRSEQGKVVCGSFSDAAPSENSLGRRAIISSAGGSKLAAEEGGQEGGGTGGIEYTNPNIEDLPDCIRAGVRGMPYPTNDPRGLILQAPNV